MAHIKKTRGLYNAPYTEQMRDEKVTILAPDIFPTHMELIQDVFKMYGYDLEVLHYTGKKVIDTGLRYIHNDMCYPAICMSGQMLYALTCGDYDPHKVALIQFQTGGGCRASNYIWLLRKALANMGMDYVPVISLSFTGMEKASGFRVTPAMIIKGLMSVIYGDIIMLLKNQVLPYEKNKGDTKAVIDKWKNELMRQFSQNKGLVGSSLRKNMRAIATDFHNIERLDIKKTKVGIVGEIYVKYSSFGNNGLEEFLLSQDCEFMVPGLLGFFQFMFENGMNDYRIYREKKKHHSISAIGAKIAARLEKALIDAVKQYPEFVCPTPFSHVKELGDKVIDRGVKMGEGWLLPAETAELIENGYSNVVCAQPFGCLPNHIVGKGVIRTLRNMYPNANICPIDYDSGASKVNQENRIKLMLAVAKEAESEKSRS